MVVILLKVKPQTKGRKKKTNMSYFNRNGFGERIHNPEAYNRAVSEDRYGYNSYNYGFNDGYGCGYTRGYSDACDDNGW